MLNKYNLIAPIYSALGYLVYGKSLLNIQRELVRELPLEGKLVILGGGDGSILPDIYEHTSNLEITYIEASSSMIELARKKVPSKMNIQFIHDDSLPFPEGPIDGIFAGFFLDLFSEVQIHNIVTEGERHMSSRGAWYVADFKLPDHGFHRKIRLIQINLSIIFFKWTTNFSHNSLPKVFKTFDEMKYKSLITKTLGSGFFRAEVFKRQTH